MIIKYGVTIKRDSAKGNEFRLIVSVNFRQLAAYIIWFGTHKEYDKIDTGTIEFDVKILNYKIK